MTLGLLNVLPLTVISSQPFVVTGWGITRHGAFASVMFAYVQGTSRFCSLNNGKFESGYVVVCQACVGSPAFVMQRSSELLWVRTPLPSASTPPLKMYFTSSNGLAGHVATPNAAPTARSAANLRPPNRACPVTFVIFSFS